MGNNVIEEVYGINVFDDHKQKQYLKAEVYNELRKIILENGDLTKDIAEEVAKGMKEWAISRGATHYTHWFQPLNGITAEKHDSFMNIDKEGNLIMSFSGKALMKGETDGSSFPSGGIRATFEARGYTAWDCTSNAFIKEDASGAVLCIPTVFCSYGGQALDKKTPLLKSCDALDYEVKRVLKLFGTEDVKKVECMVGAEQEYFLVDHDKYMQREDLIFSGRTLFGANAPKGQELDDHYFGAINERVGKYMKELNQELWKLGINAKTEHNEAAPHQHELAPIYSNVNIATDHNQLTMELMKKVAKRHGLECLLHEKPFKEVNGSGKHNNYSIWVNGDKNLLEPGKTPHENAQFLLFLTAIIRAVDENAMLIRLVSSNPGNDLRLGASEAPPAIISIFLGDQLSDIVNQIIKNGKAKSSKFSSKLDIGVRSLPKISRDNTDRNRTSPVAFTGNKFEFRMLASSMSIASLNTCINVAIANVLKEFSDKLEKANDFTKALRKIIRNNLIAHSKVIFDGNGYSEEWINEAKKRGLANAKSYVEAIDVLNNENTIKMFSDLKVLSKEELASRAYVMYEEYAKTINIEAKTMIAMANKKYLPASYKYLNNLAETLNNLKLNNVDNPALLNTFNKLNILIINTICCVNELDDKNNLAKNYSNKDKAFYYLNEIKPIMNSLRKYIDDIEEIMPVKYWPVPNYASLLFDN
ncbi:MAG: glutamine synthetase III [Bacilli bacterium]|nr:glutamine synthetase III [Bacilli bacterium]